MEMMSRYDIAIPGKQQELIEKVAEVLFTCSISSLQKAKGIVILVVASGSSVDIKFARDNDKVLISPIITILQISGIFWTGYAAQQGGEALAKLIFGDANPSMLFSISHYSIRWPSCLYHLSR